MKDIIILFIFLILLDIIEKITVKTTNKILKTTLLVILGLFYLTCSIILLCVAISMIKYNQNNSIYYGIGFILLDILFVYLMSKRIRRLKK